MDLQEALQYLAAIIVIIAAGIALGMALKGRTKEVAPKLSEERLQTYTDLIGSMEGLRTADDERKQLFIEAYYRALVYAPDEVVKQLNAFLQTITVPDHEYDPAAQSAARDTAVLAMRQDAQSQMLSKTKLKSSNLYSIEINAATTVQPIMKPPSEVDTSEATAGAEKPVADKPTA